MPQVETPIDYEQYAAYYKVCGRTIRRWVADGVDVSDPQAVAYHLLGLKHVHDVTLETILDQLP